MSNANSERVSYKVETVWGDGGSGLAKEVPHTGVTGGQDSSFFESRIVRTDREIQDIVRGSFSARLTVGYELLYRETGGSPKNGLDDLLACALFANTAWSTAPSDVTGATSTGSIITKSGEFSASNGYRGRIVRVTGTSYRQYHVVTASDANTITCAPGGFGTLSGLTVEFPAYIDGGTTETSLTIERAFLDTTGGDVVKYPGALVEGMTLNVALNGPVSGDFTFLAQKEDDVTAAWTAPTSADSASTNRVFDSVGHVKRAAIGATPADFTFMSLSLALTNNLAGREVVGSEGLESIRVGSRSISGTFTSYFSDNAQLEDFLSNTETALLLAFEDSLGNAYGIWLPSVVLTDGRRNGGGKDTDIRAEIAWRAKKSSTYGLGIRICRIDA
jgi:hypothetical protein